MAYVLFSPVGTTDPISKNRDGSMLHIIRNYRPEHIILYLSKEMLDNERQDHRYTDTIRWLAEAAGDYAPEIETIERGDLTEVQRFDFFLREYRDVLTEIHARFPEHELLLNVSSGSPAMKSALNTLGCVLPYKVYPVQISTPERKQNQVRVYDPRAEWEGDKDNLDEARSDRLEVVQYEYFQVELTRQNIAAHLKVYDYEAAQSAARSFEKLLPPKTLRLLNAAKLRATLQWNKIPKELWDSFQVFASPETDLRWTNLSEYLLWLRMKQERAELMDFMRGLTPALFTLMRVAVEDHGGIHLSALCSNGDYIPAGAFNRSTETRSYQCFFPDWAGSKGFFLQNTHYAKVITKRLKKRPWAAALLELREIEECCRNPIAHTITPVDESLLQQIQLNKSLSGRKSGDILKLFKDAVRQLNQDAKSAGGKALNVSWDAYREMNRLILASMD